MSDKPESDPGLLGSFIIIHMGTGSKPWYQGRRLAELLTWDVDQCILKMILTIPVYRHHHLCTLYNLVCGYWLSHPSEKYDFVSWDEEIPNT